LVKPKLVLNHRLCENYVHRSTKAHHERDSFI